MSSILTIPLLITVYAGTVDFSAQLNQDGTWTVKGDPGLALYFDEGTKCLVKELSDDPPVLNEAPDNTRALTDAEAAAVLCADRRYRTCKHLLWPPAPGCAVDATV